MSRAKQNAALSLDYLDLLRNDWLDAVQDLESELDDGDARAAAAALAASRAGRRFVSPSAVLSRRRPSAVPNAPRDLGDGRGRPRRSRRAALAWFEAARVAPPAPAAACAGA